MPYLTHPDDLATLVGEGPSYRVDQLRHWLYASPVLDAADMTNLPISLSAWIKQHESIKTHRLPSSESSRPPHTLPRMVSPAGDSRPFEPAQPPTHPVWSPFADTTTQSSAILVADWNR